MPMQPPQLIRSTKPRTGLRELARHLSLSVWTVSKSLNGQSGVGEKTRRRVIEAATAVGYVPNRQAQMLRQKRTRSIGLLLPTLGNPVYAERMEDIYQSAELRGYEVLVTSYEQDTDRQARLCRDLIGRRVEAIIVAGGVSGVPLRSMVDHRIPILVVNGGEVEGAAILKVDQGEGARRLLEHLLKLGHRRPLLMTGGWAADSERMNGVKTALREAGLPEDAYLMGGGRPRTRWMEEGCDRTLEAFANDRRAATAVMASNDLVAIGVIAALGRLGLSVPGDVSVTGMDDIAASRFSRPALTTVSQTHMNLGRQAVEMVVSILDGQSPTNMRRVLSPELVVRESTGPAR